MKKVATTLRPISIKSRITLLTLAILIAAISLSALIAKLALQRSITAEVEVQQRAIANLQAKELDDELQSRLFALRTTALNMNTELLADPTRLTTFLNERYIVKSLFNGGLGVLGMDGTLIASIPHGTAKGVNYMDRPHFRAALLEGREVIGQPVISKVDKAPVISVVVPIRGADGTVIGALGGAIDLAKANFLDDVTDYAYGHTGYFLLIDNTSGMIITSTHKRRVMVPQHPAETAPLLTTGTLPAEGRTATVHSPQGESLLATATPIPTANWIILAALPTAEALSPLRSINHLFALAVLTVALFTGALVWWLLRGLLAPLSDNLAVLSALADDPSLNLKLPVHRQDEIGQLSKAFNRLLVNLRHQEQALRDSEFRWKYATEGAKDGLWDWDIQHETIFFSEMWKSMLGYSDDEIGNGLNEWESRVHPDDLPAALAALQEHFDGKTPFYSNEHRVKCKDGTYKWILDRGVVVNRDADGQPLRMIGTHSDIDSRRALEEQIRNQALQDPLTKLPNRRLLKDALQQAALRNQRHGCKAALLFLDLDNFKPINDNHGHDAGDLLLIEVAARLKGAVRTTDTVTRLGGDEFVILLEDLNINEREAHRQAVAIAEKIRSKIAEPFHISLLGSDGRNDNIVHHCTASIGVTLFGEVADQEQVLRQADDAMYDAKAGGRNQVCYRDLLAA